MQTPDYDGAFQRAIEQWRGRHRVKEDDTVMLILELFRIHQDHWDGIRQRDTVGLLEFRKMIERQNESMRTLKFAFRQLLKNPGFTAVAVLMLALGIGATAAVWQET
jgi:hypothetical protein